MTRAMIIGCGRFSGFQDPKNLNYYYGALKKTNIKLESYMILILINQKNF